MKVNHQLILDFSRNKSRLGRTSPFAEVWCTQTKLRPYVQFQEHYLSWLIPISRFETSGVVTLDGETSYRTWYHCRCFGLFCENTGAWHLGRCRLSLYETSGWTWMWCTAKAAWAWWTQPKTGLAVTARNRWCDGRCKTCCIAVSLGCLFPLRFFPVVFNQSTDAELCWKRIILFHFRWYSWALTWRNRPKTTRKRSTRILW